MICCSCSKCFNQLGICQSVDATRKNIDLMVAESHEQLQQRKEDVEAMESLCEVCV